MFAMSNKLVVIGLLSILVALKLTYNEAVLFKFSNYVCESFDKSWFTIDECRIRAISRNKTTLNFNGTFHQPVNNLTVTGQFFNKANGYKPWLYKVTIDICRFKQKPYSAVAIILYKLVRDFTNLNHTCPYEGELLVKGFYFKQDLLPVIMPSGDYLFAMTWKSQNITKFTTKIYFVFTED